MIIIEKFKSIYLYPYLIYKKIENYVMLYYLMLFIIYYNSTQHNSLQYTKTKTNTMSQLQYLVIPNDGRYGDMYGNMYNQCMWLSLTRFLQLHGYPYITTRRVRAQAGLDSSTETTSFDFTNRIFATALYRIAQIYNLLINVISINRDGTRLHNGGTFIMDPIQGEIYDIDTYIPTVGALYVNIAQYGTSHFELIVAGPQINPIANAHGAPFVPAIPMKTTTCIDGSTSTNTPTTKTIMRKITELTPAEKEIASLHQETIHFLGIRKILEQDIRTAQNQLQRYDVRQRELLNSPDLPRDLKAQCIESLSLDQESTLRIINEYKQKLQRTDIQICEFQTRISNLEG